MSSPVSPSAVVAVDSRVVKVGSSGADFASINDAIRASVDGDTVVVKLGQYDEVVILDKSVSVVAEANIELGDVVIAGGAVCTASRGSLERLTIKQLVDIRSGGVHIVECDISMGADCVRVGSEAHPVIKKCFIHHAQSSGDGIYFAQGSRGNVEDCDIASNRVNGVHVNGADVVVRGSRFRESPYGVFVRNGGKGSIEDNRVEGASCFGIYVQSHSTPLVARNAIGNCGIHGIMVSKEGQGMFKENAVHGSVRILRGCAPTLGTNSFQGRVDDENSRPLVPAPPA